MTNKKKLFILTVLFIFFSMLTLLSLNLQSNFSVSAHDLPASYVVDTNKIENVPQYAIQIYFSKHPNSDKESDLVYPVTRNASNIGAAEYAIRQIISGPEKSESNAGYFSALKGMLINSSNCNGDFSLSLNKRGIVYEEGTITLKFCKDLKDMSIDNKNMISTEIQTTLMQFNIIKDVVILQKDGNCFNDLSGINLCLATDTPIDATFT